MARINRTDIIQKAVNDLAFSTSTDKIPTETLDKVQLTYDLNRRFSSFIVSTGQSTSGTITLALPSISAGAEIFLTSINYSFVKDATCDTATSALSISVTPDASNVATQILRPSVLTLTAERDGGILSLPYPLKVKPGTSITMLGSFTAGAMRRDLTATGFITSSN